MKHLYKSRTNKMLAGVCGGIAEYVDVDPVLVRIIFVIFTFFHGFGVLAYIIGAIIIPYPPLEPGESTGTSSQSPNQQSQESQESQEPQQSQPFSQKQQSMAVSGKNTGSLIFGIILLVLGTYFLMRHIPFFHDFYWWIHWNIHDYIVPTVLILLGIALLIKSKRS